MKALTMLFASLLVITLVAVTWALTRVSAWIVLHDPVWDQMDREGANFEHAVAEVFLVVRNDHFMAAEVAVGILFLILLWRILPSSQPKKS